VLSIRRYISSGDVNLPFVIRPSASYDLTMRSLPGTVSPGRLEAEIAAAVRSLSRWPGVRRIWLFGSAADGADRLDWRSDLDFAMEGLAGEFHCRAWAELDEAVGLPVDLVRWEEAGPTLRERITARGTVVYET
jgi:predicted nucleotidyltransferase